MNEFNLASSAMYILVLMWTISSVAFASTQLEQTNPLQNFLKFESPLSSDQNFDTVVPVQGTHINLEALRILAEAENNQLEKTIVVEKLKVSFRYGISIFLILALVLMEILVIRALSKRRDYTTRDLLNVMGLVLIIFSIVLVVVIADTDQQLTTSVGVLGTIAGYLFGSLRAGRSRARMRTIGEEQVPPDL